MDKTRIAHSPNEVQVSENFLSGVDDLISKLKKSRDEIDNFLSDIEEKALSSRNLLSQNCIAYNDNKDLHKLYSKGFNLLSLSVMDIRESGRKLHSSYNVYSDTLKEKELDNGNPTLTLSRRSKKSVKNVLFQSRVLCRKLSDLRDITQNSIDNIQPTITLADYLLKSKNSKIMADIPIADLYKKLLNVFEYMETGYSHVADRKNWVKDQYKYHSEALAKSKGSLKKEEA